MRRGEVWWAEFPKPVGGRPVVLLSRDEAYSVRELITVAPVTTKIRTLPVEVPLGRAEGLDRPCVVNLDTLTTIPKRCLQRRIALLTQEKIEAMEEALRFALGLEP